MKKKLTKTQIDNLRKITEFVQSCWNKVLKPVLILIWNKLVEPMLYTICDIVFFFYRHPGPIEFICFKIKNLTWNVLKAVFKNTYDAYPKSYDFMIDKINKVFEAIGESPNAWMNIVIETIEVLSRFSAKPLSIIAAFTIGIVKSVYQIGKSNIIHDFEAFSAVKKFVIDYFKKETIENSTDKDKVLDKDSITRKNPKVESQNESQVPLISHIKQLLKNNGEPNRGLHR